MVTIIFGSASVVNGGHNYISSATVVNGAHTYICSAAVVNEEECLISTHLQSLMSAASLRLNETTKRYKYKGKGN